MPVGPAFLQGPVKAFSFAVLPRMPWLDQDVLGLQAGQHGLEVFGEPVSERVIRHYPFHRCPVRGHERCGPSKEPGAGDALLIRVNLDEREPGVIIDSHVNVVETNPGMPFGMVTDGLVRVRPPAASVRDPAEFLHIDVDHVPGCVAFVAAFRGT